MTIKGSTVVNRGAVVVGSGEQPPAAVVYGAPYAPHGPVLTATSVTSLAIGIGPKTFTTQYSLGFGVGMRVRAASASSPTSWLEGVVTAYEGNQLTIQSDLTSTFLGTFNDWVINLTGQPGQAGAQGPQGQQGQAGTPGGPAGPQGPEGAQGPQGFTGPAGPLGPPGNIGPIGPVGPAGSTGLQGPQGVQGEPGDPGGPPGPEGPPGPQGEEGPQGVPGAKGNTGDTGLQGATGPAGIQGIQGVAGPAGAQGPKGDTGATGPAGTPGAGIGSATAPLDLTGGVISLPDGSVANTKLVSVPQGSFHARQSAGTGPIETITSAQASVLLGNTKSGFAANKSADQTGIGNEVFTKITFPAAAINVGTLFDIAQSRWVPPLGPGYIVGQVYFSDGLLLGTPMWLAIYKNGALLRQAMGMAAANYAGIGITIFEQANGADYYELYTKVMSGSTATINAAATSTYFMGSQL